MGQAGFSNALGQGRFCKALRSYSRGTQRILLLCDITNSWSLGSSDGSIKAIEKSAPRASPGSWQGMELSGSKPRRSRRACVGKGPISFKFSQLCNFSFTSSSASYPMSCLCSMVFRLLSPALRVPHGQTLAAINSSPY